MIGMDYERGLNMLKEYIELGEVNSKMEFIGVKEFPACKYLGVKTISDKDVIDKKMKDDFTKVYDVVMQSPENIAGNPFTIYHKWDAVSGKVVYTCCVPVKSIPADLPKDVFADKMSTVKVHTVKHKGAYKHLANPWMTNFAMARNKEFKINKKVAPFEIYLNSPKDTIEKDLVVEVSLPIKA